MAITGFETMKRLFIFCAIFFLFCSTITFLVLNAEREIEFIYLEPKNHNRWCNCATRYCGQPSAVLSSAPYAGELYFEFKFTESIEDRNTDFIFLIEKINLNTLSGQSKTLENVEFLIDLNTRQLVYEFHTLGQPTVFIKSEPITFSENWYSVKLSWGNSMKLYLDEKLVGENPVKGFMLPGTDTCIFVGSNRDCEKPMYGMIRGLKAKELPI